MKGTFTKMQYGEYLRAHTKKHKYDIGNKVRKAVSKGIFSKSYKFKTFSDKLYEIVDKVFSNPPNVQIKRPEVRGPFRWCFISRAASACER